MGGFWYPRRYWVVFIIKRYTPMQYSAISEDSLWDLYFDSQSISARNHLVEYYTAFAKKMALNVYMGRARKSEVSLDDCFSVAILELIGCIERFDPDKNIRFTTFSFSRIRGAVHDFISCSSERMSIVNFHRQNATVSHERYSALFEGMDSFEGLLSAVLDISTAFYLEESNDSPEEIRNESVYSDPHASVFHLQLREAVDSLGEPDSVVIASHYFRQMSFADIAGLLAVTPARISQLHKRALRKLRSTIN